MPILNFLTQLIYGFFSVILIVLWYYGLVWWIAAPLLFLCLREIYRASERARIRRQLLNDPILNDIDDSF